MQEAASICKGGGGKQRNEVTGIKTECRGGGLAEQRPQPRRGGGGGYAARCCWCLSSEEGSYRDGWDQTLEKGTLAYWSLYLRYKWFWDRQKTGN